MGGWASMVRQVKMCGWPPDMRRFRQKARKRWLVGYHPRGDCIRALIGERESGGSGWVPPTGGSPSLASRDRSTLTGTHMVGCSQCLRKEVSIWGFWTPYDFISMYT